MLSICRKSSLYRAVQAPRRRHNFAGGNARYFYRRTSHNSSTPKPFCSLLSFYCALLRSFSQSLRSVALPSFLVPNLLRAHLFNRIESTRRNVAPRWNSSLRCSRLPITTGIIISYWPMTRPSLCMPRQSTTSTLASLARRSLLAYPEQAWREVCLSTPRRPLGLLWKSKLIDACVVVDGLQGK